MKITLLVVIMVSTLLSACGPVLPSQLDSEYPIIPANSTPEFADYPDLGVAPELSNDVWINANSPLRLADLRGKVILLDMWTFG